MTEIHRTALVNCSAEYMFDLVNDVVAYPKRFSWCVGAQILERNEEVVVARLDLKFAGMRHGFTTRNMVDRPSRLQLHLVDGPLRHLEGEWRFIRLGQEGCRVHFSLDFEYAGHMGQQLLKLGFQRLANRMMDDFCNEARRQECQAG